MVHKLVCDGTIEEKINAMIQSKKELAENVLGGGGEKWLTELSDDELLSVLRLDGCYSQPTTFELKRKSEASRVERMLKNAGRTSGRTMDEGDIRGLFGI